MTQKGCCFLYWPIKIQKKNFLSSIRAKVRHSKQLLVTYGFMALRFDTLILVIYRRSVLLLNNHITKRNSNEKLIHTRRVDFYWEHQEKKRKKNKLHYLWSKARWCLELPLRQEINQFSATRTNVQVAKNWKSRRYYQIFLQQTKSSRSKCKCLLCIF